MVENSKIEWTHHTFNPWIGCTKVSPGCDHCYAERDTARFKTVKWGSGNPRKHTGDSYWQQPVRWNKQAEAKKTRYRVFCASLADVFDNEVSDEWRIQLFELIKATPNLDWLLLTKRVGNIQKMIASKFSPMPSNVWMGISVVNQEEANRDIPKLAQVPCRTRFLSMEPLLGPVDLQQVYPGKVNIPGVDWVIVGGESGPHARIMREEWAIDLKEQCVAAGIPFLFKQWGEWAPVNYDELPSETQEDLEIRGKLDYDMIRVGKKKAGRELQGRTWDEYPMINQV